MHKQTYQIIPPLTGEEYNKLKEDIAERGVMVAIEFDEDGNCLDGHNRLKACEELGITDYPKVIRAGMDEEEKDEHAVLLNVSRRHLTAEQKVEVAKTLKTRHPEWPIIKIAKMLHIQREYLAGQLDHMDNLPTVEGEDGKKYPANEEAAEQKRGEIRDELEKHPEKSNREIAKETGVSHHTVGAQRKKMVSAYNPSKRDEEALKDKDIVNRLASDKKMTVARALKEQKRDRIATDSDADEDKGIEVDIIRADDVPGVNGVRIVRAGTAEDPDAKAEMYNMDCLAYMDTLPDKSVDLIVADPPYFEVWGDFDFVWKSEDEYLKWIYKCLHGFSRILKPTGTLMLWGTLGGSHLTLCKVMLSIEKNELFIKKNMVTQRNTRGAGVQDNYMNCREDLLFYTKSDSYTFNVPYTDEISVRADLGSNDMPRENDYKRVSNVWCDIAEASQSSIERNFHPTTKALKLCSRIIETHSNEGDLVYIPFTGSGSEVVSCIKNNRQFVGTEINEEYFAKSIDRIKDLLSRKDVAFIIKSRD